MLIKINNDLYDIASRIKEIDKRYSIAFDTCKQAYTLYCDDKYQLAFPYENLDTRALDYAFETRLENLDTLLNKVDKHNEEMQKKNMRLAHDEFENAVTKIL